MKTPISYYGGKQNLLSKILPLIPKHRIYTEAFFGGGAVFFAKALSEAEVINDTDGMVVNFYKVLKRDFALLKAKVEQTLFSRATYSVALAIYRIPHLFSPLQRAWAFYVATNMGFACHIGSWGFDKYGKRARSFQNKKMAFDTSLSKRLENVTIECNDACKVISTYDTADAFHYVDPPYLGTNLGHYGGYTPEHYKQLLDTLSNVKGKFLLSSFPSEMLSQYIEDNGWYTLSIEKTLTASKYKRNSPRPKKVETLSANFRLQVEVKEQTT